MNDQICADASTDVCKLIARPQTEADVTLRVDADVAGK